MPGTDVVSKSTTLGGAVGIVVLAFALAYRFFPGVLTSNPQVQQQVQTNAPSAPAPWTVSGDIAGPAKPVAESPVKPVGTTRAQAIAMGPPVPMSKEVGALLAKAREAELEGRVLEPKDSSAMALYQEALVKDANNSTALNGLERIGGAVRDWATAAISRGDAGDAERYVGVFAELPHAPPELTALKARLATLHEVTPLIARAASLLKDGKATGSDQDNALAVYRQVMRLDPDNQLADEGLAQIERVTLDKALAAAAQDDFPGADSMLAEASAIRPGSQALLDTRARIEGIRRQRAETVLAQARSALDAGNADLAEQLGKRAQSISPDLAGLDEFNQRISNARLYASLSPGQVFQDRFLDMNGAAPPVVVIPTGSFIMGSPADEGGNLDNEEPRRLVSITVGFALGQTEVTVAQFRLFVRASDYVTDAEKLGSGSYYDETTGRMSDRAGITWQNDYQGGRARDSLPVINVSWNDAEAYLDWVSQRTGKRYRLPSEAEEEYAIRAGSATRYPWGEGDPDKAIGNFTGEGDRSPTKRSWAKFFPRYSDGFWGPAPVKTFPPNGFGLYDMDGNVSEWVQDCWHDNYVRAPRDSQAWINPGCSSRVIRGGSWGSDPDQVRSAFRIPAPADTRSARVGFRVARDL